MIHLRALVSRHISVTFITTSSLTYMCITSHVHTHTSLVTYKSKVDSTQLYTKLSNSYNMVTRVLAGALVWHSSTTSWLMYMCITSHVDTHTSLVTYKSKVGSTQLYTTTTVWSQGF